MPAIVDRAKERIAEVRERRPAVDHVVRMQEHYGKAQGSQQAGAVTYFGFLSFFPVMALAFFVVGYVAKIWPQAQDNLVTAIGSLLPGIIGNGKSQIHLSDIESAAGAVGLVGLVGVIYAGLGWLSALRNALIAIFELPEREQPNFVVGKLRDLVTLATIGVVLIIAVAVSGLVAGYSTNLLDWIGLSTQLSFVVRILTIVLGLAANALLFFVMFRLLADPDDIPPRALWSGALLGAVGFEILKQVSALLLKSTQGQPAFQVFGIALILVVWINYFSRLVLYAAAWAWTAPEARDQRASEPAAPVQGPPLPSIDELPHREASRSRKGAFAAGAVAGAAAATVIKGSRDRD